VSDRLGRQLAFVLEIDRLKTILRQTAIADGSRRENSGEHSWHLAMMALVLAEHSPEPVVLERVLGMLLVHDIVEIDAGDTFAYDTTGNLDKLEREERAAERIFGLLPDDQAAEIRVLWDEFEVRETPEARFAAALDRLQPILLNMATEGRAWREHGVTAEMVLERNRHVAEGAPALWEHIRGLVDEAVGRGWLVG
jgi:putative hydrolase of HD superfamily